MTKLTNGSAEYFGTPYRTDDGSGPVTAYQGAAAAPPPNGIPPAQ